MQVARDDARWNERSWGIWTIAEHERARIVASQGRKFPAIPSDRISELFDVVQERACAPQLSDGTFPGGAYKHADLEFVPAFLAEALFNALREHKRRRFDRTVADGDAVLPHLSDGVCDLADVVHNRRALDVIAEQAGELADDVKAYMWADHAGVKRADILATSGWSGRKLRAVRREIDDFRARARVAVAALLPFPLVHRLLGTQGANALAGGSATKALVACGAVATAAACGVGAIVLEGAPERSAPARPPAAREMAHAPTPAATAAVRRQPRPVATPRPELPTRTRKAARRTRKVRAAAPAAAPNAAPRVQAVTAAPAADPPAVREATSDDFNREFSP